MGHEQHRHSILTETFQFPHQPDPVAGIYGGGRFIRYQKGGLAHQRRRDHQPLEHSARQCKGITVQNPLGIFQPQPLQNVGKQALHFLPRRFSMMEQIGLFQLTPHPDGRVKGGHGVLHNQADFFPIDSLSLSFRQVEQIFLLEQNFASSTISVPQQPHNCLADGGLSRAGAANDGEHFPLA